MKKILLLLLLLNCLWSYSQNIAATDQLAEKRSIQVINWLHEKEYEEIYQFFSEEMSNNFPMERMDKSMTSFFKEYGLLKSIEDFSVKVTAENIYYHRGMRLEKGEFDLVFSMDKNQKMNSFRIAPYTQVYKWSPPSYADTTEIVEQNIEIKDEFPLISILTTPKNKPLKTIVVFVHGSGPNDMDATVGPNKIFKDLAYGLATNGIASIRYNKRSFDYPSSTAKKMHEIDFDDVVTNDAIKALKKAKKLGADKVILLGHSLGGHLAPRIANEVTIDGVIVMAGNVSPLYSLLKPQYEHLMKYDSSSKVNDYLLNTLKTQVKNIEDKNYDENTPGPLLPLGLPGKFWVNLQDYSPVKLAKTQAQPYLILNGKRDYQVNTSEAKKWKNGNKNKKSKTILYSQLNHLFFSGEGISIPKEYDTVAHLDEKVLRDIIRWIEAL